LHRTPVRIGIRGGIVAIEHARARIVAIVSVAQTDRAANGVSRDPPALMERAVQSYYIFLLSASQRARNRLNLYYSKLARGPRPEARLPPYGGCVLCSLREPYAMPAPKAQC
jgi:hypothetical protein